MAFGRLSLALSFSVLTALAVAQSQDWHDRYDARDLEIPMRDGVKLHTVVYIPKFKTGTLPILMERTPYGAGKASYPPHSHNPKFMEAGYILAFQDVRGKGRSEGEFVNVRPLLKPGQKGIDESTDTYDTVAYLIKNVPKNSGRVGLWGISYPGFYAGAGAVHNHPALKAVSPQAPVNDWFMGDDVHHRGVLFLQETFGFSMGFDVPRGQEGPNIDYEGLSSYDFHLKAGALSNYESKFVKGKVPYWQELLDHPNYDQYWQDRALWRSFKDVHCAVLTVGGLFDKEDMFGAITLFKKSEKQNPGTPNFFAFGPWSHGQWASVGGSSLGGLEFGSPTANWYQENVEFPFFERYLRGDETVKPPAKATVFETGTNRWHSFNQWPPAGVAAKPLFFHGDGSLGWSNESQSGSKGYMADPTAPTPYVYSYESSKGAPGGWLALDQRFLAARQDNVVFTLPELKDDLLVAGPITADLWIKTTGTDADLVVQVIDEYPENSTEKTPSDDPMGGFQMMVRGEIMRAKFRNSFEKPEPITPGKPTRVKFELNDVLHTFRKGHRILVRVQSYWFPIADRNPNKFVDINKAKDSDFQKAHVDILTGGKNASLIQLGVLPAIK